MRFTRSRSRIAVTLLVAGALSASLLQPVAAQAAQTSQTQLSQLPPVPGHASTTAAPSPSSSTRSKPITVKPLTAGNGDPNLTKSSSIGATSKATIDGDWQSVGGSAVKLSHASAKAGSASAAGTSGPEKVHASVLSPQDAKKRTGSPIAIEIQRTDGSRSAGPVAVQIPTNVLASLYGGDYASRLRWVQVPASEATSQKSVAAAAKPVAATETKNSVLLTPQASSTPMMMTAQASGASSAGSGDYTATPLNTAAEWDVSTQTGDFSWSYPIRTVPVAAGPQPKVALSYDSQSVDGETGATNNQPSAVGEGWSLTAGGFIQRNYVPCALDDGPTGPIANSGDLCWKADNATLSIAGHAGQLTQIGTTGQWRLQSDDGTRIQHAAGSPNCGSNGTWDVDCWVVTTTDGTRYFFGSRSASQSTWTVPVFGNDPGEPCNSTAFCMQAWRWNLDEVVDVHGNAEVYYYNAQNNIYSRQGTTPTLYMRGGELDHIDYGMNVNHVTDANAASATVSFGYDAYGRCDDASHANCTSEPSAGFATAPAHPADYPDVPFDQNCTSGSCTGLLSPSFWTVSTLASITTTSWSAGVATKVDSWALSHSFPDPGDGGAHSLWLTRVDHTGYVGGTATEPPTLFSGTPMQNRVMTLTFSALYKYRLSGVVTSLGGSINVQYSGTDCQPSDGPSILANPWSNNRRCFPEEWAPPGNQPQMDLFHKYVVTQVQASPVTGTPNVANQITTYTYGTPAWRYETSPLVPSKERTWSRFAGFNQVTVLSGDPNAPSAEKRTDYTFYQGLNGDRAGASGGTKSVMVTGTSIPDDLWFAGNAYETKVSNGSGGQVVSDTTNAGLWVSGQTASDSFGTAYMTGDHVTTASTPLSTGGSVTTTTTTTHDPTYGYPTTVETTHSDSAPASCVTSDYVNNTSAWLIGLVSHTRNVSATCATAFTPANVASETRTAFDSLGYGASPTLGDVTESGTATSYDGSNQPQYTVMTKSAFDAMGRVVSSTDALSHTTTTAYTPAAGAAEPGSLTSAVVTNTTAPVTWKTSTTYQPTWNVPVEVSDQNAKITDLTYDPLGRRTAVWLPGNSKTANPADPNSAHSYTLSQTVPSFVTTTTLKATSKVTTYSLYDGLGQLIQNQAPNVAGKTTVTDYGYDTQGNQTLVDNPYWTADVTPSGTLFVPNNVSNIPSATATQYDPSGRLTAQLTLSYGAEKFRTTSSYPGSDRTDVNPPSGGTPTTTFSNSLGQRTSLVQYQASSISATAPTITTTYSYDTLGKLATMRDQDGNTWTWNYDLLGNQTSATDPDTGTTTTKYDAGGNLVTSTDARGVVLAYTYDTLNRKTAVYTGSPAGAIQSKWTYDGVTGALGQISSATTYTGSTPTVPGAAYTTSYTGYDSGYQPTGQTVSIPAAAPAFGGTSYSFTLQYNRDETLKTKVIPAMGGLGIEGLRYGYDSLGNLSSLSGTNTYGIINYTNVGQVGSITRGNTVALASSFGYDPATGALAGKVETETNGSTISTPATLTYTRNSAGDITEAQNKGTSATDTQCYQYDTLRNLTQAWTPANNTCDPAGPGASTTLGGPAPYWTSYGIDDVTGNRTQTTNHTSGGTATSASTYGYPVAGATQPHAVSTIATTGAGAGTSSYRYDPAGNTTSRPGQTMAWDSLGRLASITVAGVTQSNVYTPDGHLFLQTDSTTGSTLFIGETQLHLAPGSSTSTAVRDYDAAGHTVAERTTKAGVTGSSMLFTATDNNGTVYLEIDATSGALTQRYTDPNGNSRGTAATWSSGNGYLNAATNPFASLTQLGARSYDSVIGKFLSVDSVLSPFDPGQNNGYSYSSNSPITLADPSGLDPCTSETTWSYFACGGTPPPANGNDGSGNTNPSTSGGLGSSAIGSSDGGDTGQASPGAGSMESSSTEYACSVSYMACPAPAKGEIPAWDNPVPADELTLMATFVAGAAAEACEGTEVEAEACSELYAAESENWQAEVETLKSDEGLNGAAGGAGPVRIGQAGEAAVRASYDIGPKVSEVIDGRKRIFDGLNDEAVSEVKNVQYQAFTQQLKDSLAYAQANGRRFDLYVRGGESETTLSGPLKAAVMSGEVNLRFIP